jgi:hypothetical protein
MEAALVKQIMESSLEVNQQQLVQKSNDLKRVRGFALPHCSAKNDVFSAKPRSKSYGRGSRTWRISLFNNSSKR